MSSNNNLIPIVLSSALVAMVGLKIYNNKTTIKENFVNYPQSVRKNAKKSITYDYDTEMNPVVEADSFFATRQESDKPSVNVLKMDELDLPGLSEKEEQQHYNSDRIPWLPINSSQLKERTAGHGDPFRGDIHIEPEPFTYTHHTAKKSNLVTGYIGRECK